ncbi:WhiB family transcriptional regulator [Cellulosimicrobium cellulans]|uniref:WhiB family transcriptional regulator n=1 Tax=Cellulosimicrobium cellulans TaxID=1710 RepID=UPI001966B9F6|nr:WhiB family transcriptional regulator [Cellulosimicrobium cellulans]MBN0039359.1 WhiB family transcriptional regulator [Cellulosimicrobium cellulans]
MRSDAGVGRTNRPAAGRGKYDPQAWANRAACLDEDPELFFHPEGETGRARRDREAGAKQVCAGCDVREVCLASALDRRERFGVWGGTGEEERAALLRARRSPRQGKAAGGRPAREVTQADVETIRRLHGEGRSQREIADHLGWYPSRVCRLMARLGIDARTDAAVKVAS